MDDVLIEKIFEIIKHSNGFKAKKIAKQLEVSRKDVNKILYGRLTSACIQDKQYLWYCNPISSLNIIASLDNCTTKLEDTFSNTNFTVEELDAFLKNIEKGKN